MVDDHAKATMQALAEIESQLRVSDKYAADQRGTDPIVSVWQLQNGHLRDGLSSLRKHLEAVALSRASQGSRVGDHCGDPDCCDCADLGRKMASDVERVARAIDDADATFGYSIRLTGLVDGVSTFSLDYGIGEPVLTFGSHSDAAEHVANRRNQLRAAAVIAALSHPATPQAPDLCAKDNQPCYVGAGTEDAHYRCGTSSCKAATPQAPEDVRERVAQSVLHLGFCPNDAEKIAAELQDIGLLAGPLPVTQEECRAIANYFNSINTDILADRMGMALEHVLGFRVEIVGSRIQIEGEPS